MISKTNNCVACKSGQHLLFKCDKFKPLDIPKHIKIVRNAGLCYNYMRSHLGKACKYKNCIICQKEYNTLLHLAIVEKEDDAPDLKTNRSE